MSHDPGFRPSLAPRLRRWLAALLLLAPGAARGFDYTVDSTADTPDIDVGDRICNDGTKACTLRAAIQEVTASASSDRILFNLPGPPPYTIRLTSSLPEINDHLGTTIDGASQPGFAGTPVIEIDGTDLTASHCMRTPSGHLTLVSLCIHSCGSSGLVLGGSHLNTIQGCYIGTDLSGTIAKPNGAYGIFVFESTDNYIGGILPGEGNLISGNGSDGIYISTRFANSNSILGNLIGTDVTGTRALGNGIGGISVGSNSTYIGGTDPRAANVISGNGLYGVQFRGAEARTNTLDGNKIGTDRTGTLAIPNLRGVVIDDASDNLIGGAASDSANVIAGNLDSGVLVQGAASIGNRITGNFIGVTADGVTPLANGGHGVLLEQGASGNGVGGVAAGEGNVIAHNGRNGVLIEDGERNQVRGNAIFDNGALGIDLGLDAAVTPNDPGDVDAGANQLLNFPDLATVVANCSTTDAQGTVMTLPNTPITVELFANPACDASGHGEGARFLGSVWGASDAGGTFSFLAQVAPVAAGTVVTATSTDTAGNTSEFSACATATPGCAGCIVGNLGRVTGLRGVKRGTCAAEFSWTLDPAAGSTHLNTVAVKADLVDPRRVPGNGLPLCDVPAPGTSCTDNDTCSDPVAFYQALAACGPAGTEEGPW